MSGQTVAILRHMGGFVFDAVLSEDHTSSIDVTETPVENGSVISDHATVKPDRLTIKAGVGEIAIGEQDQFASEGGRARKAFELLKALQVSREPFDVQTGLYLYKNMLIADLKPSQDATTGNALLFVAELVSVKIVNTKTEKIARAKPGKVARQASATKKRGEQQGEEVAQKKEQDRVREELRKAMRDEDADRAADRLYRKYEDESERTRREMNEWLKERE